MLQSAIQFASPFELFENAAMAHAASVHLPIALALVGIPLLVLSLVCPKSHTIRWIAIVAYTMLILSALIAVSAGEAVEGNVPGSAAQAVFDDFDQHEWLARKVWITGAVVLGLLLLSAIPHVVLQRMAATLALLAGLACAGWIMLTAHHGGRLVYVHGVGVPAPRVTAPEEPQPPSGIIAEQPDASPPPAPIEPGDEQAAAPPPIDEATDWADPTRPFAARYNLQIRAILEDRCFNCHNPRRRGGPRGDLDLTTIEAVLKGGARGPSVAPGEPHESVLLRAVTWEDPDLRMPPRQENRLSPEEIEILRAWISDAGAPI